MNLRILFVEDSPDDVALMLRRLREAGIESHWQRVQTAAALREALAGERWELARGEEIELKLRTPGWRARRWVVEAAHSWLNRNRALLVRWSKKAENHLALLQLACGLIAFKKAHGARLAAALQG